MERVPREQAGAQGSKLEHRGAEREQEHEVGLSIGVL